MKRLFIAIDYIDDGNIASLTKHLRLSMSKLDKVNWIDSNLFHITLKFIGETPEDKVAGIIHTINAQTFNFQKFTVEFDQLRIFGNKYHPRIIMLALQPNERMTALHASINKKLRIKNQIKPDFGNFVPHLTLARIHSIDDKKLFWNAIQTHQNPIVAPLTIDKIVLYESVLQKGYQPKYEVIKTFLLK